MYVPIAGVLNHFSNLLANILTFNSNKKISEITIVFTPQPLMAVGVLFSPMVSGWSGGRASGRAGGK